MIGEGSRLQEEKISDMARLANEMFPEIEELDFKGAVFLAIKVCMEAYHLKQWKDVVKKPPFYRRTFFECILSEAVPHLKAIGLTEEKIEILTEKLKIENEKYLARDPETGGRS